MLPDAREQVLDPITAYQVVSMAQGVVEEGTATALKSLGKTLGGKTGTTNDFKDAWFVGYTPDLVVGVWTGFDRPRNMGEGESGGEPVAQGGFEEGREQRHGQRERQQADQERSMHDVHAQFLVAGEQAQHQQHSSDGGRDQCGLVDSAGEEEAAQAERDIEEREDDSDSRHACSLAMQLLSLQ
jgi:membrane carboxypeptidase/penicillin-binding protein